MTAFGSLMGALSLYFFLQGGKGGRPLLFHPLVTIAWCAAGQLYGIGPVGLLVVPAIIVINKSLEPKNMGIPPPATAAYTYTALAATIATTVVGGLLSNVPTEHPSWKTINILFQARAS
jgi:hypothetical protein